MKKEICDVIRNAIPIWNDKTDEEISRRCSLYDMAEILVCNPRKVLHNLHKDTEYVYSDEGLFELCQANGYEFNENGEAI